MEDDYNLDEIRNLYDVIEADRTIQNSNSVEGVNTRGKTERSEIKYKTDISITN